MRDEETAAARLLGPLERRVMRRLWTDGPQTVAEVLGALNKGEFRPLAYTTVMTILVRLHDKGYLTRQKEGRHYRYAAGFDESALEAQVGRRELSRLIERYGAASVARFAVDLGATGLAEPLASLARKRRPQAS